MNQDPTQKKPFATPKQYAICSLFLCLAVVLIVAAIFVVACGDENLAGHLGLLFGGVVGLLLYRLGGNKLCLGAQIRNFHVTVPLVTFVTQWTACELASTLYGLIACRFSSIKPDTNDNSTLLLILGSVIIAPVSEELMFRLCGMGLLKKCSKKWFTILFTTLLFALLHSFYSMQGVVNVFTGTIFMAICYYETENILYTILVHMLHNLSCLPDLSLIYRLNNGYSLLTAPAAAVSLIVFLAGLYWFVKVFPQKYALTANVPQPDAENAS